MNLFELLMAVAIGILVFAVIILFRRLKGLDKKCEQKSKKFGPTNNYGFKRPRLTYKRRKEIDKFFD